jgi:hypothetical protein
MGCFRLGVSPLACVVVSVGVLLSAAPAHALDATVRWCSGSPEFKLQGVPKGTAKLTFRMLDLNAPGFRHGGGEVAYTGKNVVPCGALRGNSYRGPSPPSGQHTYRWTIAAVDASGKVLAETKVERLFPEK